MTDTWDERKKAIENQYFHKLEQELIEKIRSETQEKLIRKYCRNRCPKCGDEIRPLVFKDVPMDQCPSCGGVWLGPKDFAALASEDRQTWFEKWFKEGSLLSGGKTRKAG